MDTDSNDGTATESLNGGTKPDAAKLAQTAIIKQDVMLSGTTTQSPLATVSSVFTMPPVNMAHISMANSAGLGLTDHLFMSAIHNASDTPTTQQTNGIPDLKVESSAINSLSSQPAQLFGQPQVAPQFFISPGGQAIQGQSPSSAAAAAALGVQQLLIPVSTGNGTQQFISIPVSLATGGNQQIQLLTTSNGQIIATNLANLQGVAQPMNISMPNTGSAINGQHTPNHQSSQNVASSQSLQSTVSSPNQIPSLPQLLTAAGSQNALNPLLATLGAQQLLSSATAAQLSSAITTQQQQTVIPPANQLVQSTANQNGTNHTQATLQRLTQTMSVDPSSLTASLTGVTNSVHKVTQPVPSSPPNQVITTTTGLPQSVSQLLPNTVGNSTESTTVDGINLDEIKEFARQFKIRRLSLGLTQTQVGQALSATEGPAYSQSAICRFEKLDITPKSAQKIKPVLERWMEEAEDRYKNGVQNLTEFIGSEPSKKRKRRTSFTPQALEVLNNYFERNTHPSGAEMTELSEKLNYDREVIRVWFCNKRQALKNTIKKLKQDGVP